MAASLPPPGYAMCRLAILALALLLVAACAGGAPATREDDGRMDSSRGMAFSLPEVEGPLECVPYARLASGIAIRGDAWTWWNQADGRYVRASRPAIGAVLVFARTQRLPLGHVAVVTAVLGVRAIEVAHANWIPGAVTEGVRVIDVSTAGDWSAVRVFNARAGAFGRVYPSMGFILQVAVVAGA